MKNTRGIVSVNPKHIEKGIAKYGGVVDMHLNTLIIAAGLQYTPYIFNDGRILLVLPNNLAAFLYDDKDILFETLNLIS